MGHRKVKLTAQAFRYGGRVSDLLRSTPHFPLLAFLFIFGLLFATDALP